MSADPGEADEVPNAGFHQGPSRAPSMPTGLPSGYKPPPFILSSAMTLVPFGYDGKPCKDLLILGESIAYSWHDGQWNAQALGQGSQREQ